MAKKRTDIIDIRATLLSYCSKWYLFVIAVIGCLALAFVYTRIAKTKYGVRANILIQQEDANPLSQVSALGSLLGNSGYVDDEIFVISSHSLYRDVVRNLHLEKKHFVRLGFLNSELAYPDFPVDVYPAAGICDTLRVGMIFKVKVKEDGLASVKVKAKKKTIIDEEDLSLPHTFSTIYGEFTVDKTQYYPEGEPVTTTIIVTGYHAAAEDLALDVTSEVGNKRTNVIELAYDTPNPDMGEDILAEILDQYNERGIHEQTIQAQKTAEFLNERIAILGSDLDTAETNIQHFKEANGIIDVYQETLYQTEKQAKVEEQLIAAEAELEVVRLTYDYISRPENKYEVIPATLSSNAVQEVISNYNELLVKRADMLTTVKEDNLALARLTERINTLRASIIATLNQTIAGMEANVRELKSLLGNTGTRLSNIPAHVRTAGDLQRQTLVKQQLYLFLRQRQEENAMIMANATPKGLIVDTPYTLNEPLGMGKKMIFLLAFLFGLCLPPIYLYLLKLIRNKVETRDEIEKLTSAPVLGEMCIDNSGNHLVVSPTSTTSSTELFRLMRSNLLFILNDTDDKTVLLTSSVSGEGKTFIAINLAASLALLGKKVALVGMDIRAPKISSYLDVRSQFGLTQYLSSSEIEVDSIIVKDAIQTIPGLDIILAGPIPPNPAELLASKQVDELFAELKKRYDFIIVDSAPVGMVSDTFALNRIADATIFVTRVNATTVHDVDEIEEIYTNKRLNKLSIVINGVKSKKTYGYKNQKNSLAY